MSILTTAKGKKGCNIEKNRVGTYVTYFGSGKICASEGEYEECANIDVVLCSPTTPTSTQTTTTTSASTTGQTCVIPKVEVTQVESYVDLRIKDDSGNEIGDIVWKKDGSVNEPIADVRNTTGKKGSFWVHAVFKSEPADLKPTVKYYWYILDGSAAVKKGDGTLTPDTNNTISFEVINPDTVGKYKLRLEFYFCKDSSCKTSYGTDATEHTLYLTYSIPKSPEDYPKKTALEKATTYAQGGNKIEDIAKALTNGIYNENTFFYDPQDETIENDPLNMYKTANTGHICADYANLMSKLARSIGMNAYSEFVYGGTDKTILLWHWKENIFVLGSILVYNNFVLTKYGYSRLLTYHAITNIEGKRYDAAFGKTGNIAIEHYYQGTYYLIYTSSLHYANCGYMCTQNFINTYDVDTLVTHWYP